MLQLSSTYFGQLEIDFYLAKVLWEIVICRTNFKTELQWSANSYFLNEMNRMNRIKKGKREYLITLTYMDIHEDKKIISPVCMTHVMTFKNIIFPFSILTKIWVLSFLRSLKWSQNLKIQNSWFEKWRTTILKNYSYQNGLYIMQFYINLALCWTQNRLLGFIADYYSI